MRFQNGSNKVAIELLVVQFWPQTIFVISNHCAGRSVDFEITRTISDLITYRAKLLNADWPRQRAFFLNHDLEGTFGNQESAWLLDADWLSTPALGWFPALASNGFSETHRFCKLRVWSKHGYFILSWKRISLQQSAVFWWKSKRIFPTKTVLIRSVWVGTTGVERGSWAPNWKLVSSFCFGSPY